LDCFLKLTNNIKKQVTTGVEKVLLFLPRAILVLKNYLVFTSGKTGVEIFDWFF